MRVRAGLLSNFLSQLIGLTDWLVGLVRYELSMYRHCYSADYVVVRGIYPHGQRPLETNGFVGPAVVDQRGASSWLFYQPLMETPFYSQGIEIRQDGGDLYVTVLRTSVKDGKTWIPGPAQVKGLRQWDWAEAVDKNIPLPFGISRNEHVVIAKLPINPRHIFLVCGRDIRLIMQHGKT